MINTYISEQDSRRCIVIKTLKNHCDILTQHTKFLLKTLFLVFDFFMLLCVSKRRYWGTAMCGDGMDLFLYLNGHA